jgi:hypothetical protein
MKELTLKSKENGVRYRFKNVSDYVEFENFLHIRSVDDTVQRISLDLIEYYEEEDWTVENEGVPMEYTFDDMVDVNWYSQEKPEELNKLPADQRNHLDVVAVISTVIDLSSQMQQVPAIRQGALALIVLKMIIKVIRSLRRQRSNSYK